MELTLDSSPNNFKHFCKICKKGFMCGRALGGHMRAHGIGVDDAADVYEDEDATSDWEAGAGNSAGGVGSNKRMYALRTNPNRTRSRACDNCGKEFLSWKSFLEHGRCCGGGGSEEEEEEESPAASSPSSDNGDGWSKRKRTFRSEVESNFTVNDYNLANCLMMLSNAAVDPAAAAVVVDQPEESSASAERMPINFTAAPLAAWAPPPTKGLFECKACKKVFNSHQALGGHRASHKKVKGCFAARLDRLDSDRFSNFFDEQTGANNNINNSPKRVKGTKVHECSICHRVFNSGQALGGHKRCHWITPASSSAAMAMDPTLARFQQLQYDGHVGAHVQEEERRVDQAGLDLNILPGQNEDSKNVLSLKVSSEFFPKYEESINKENMKNVVVGPPKTKNDTNENSFESLKANVDDEADSKMKMAKLSELKEMNVAGGSAPWLQVGIGSNNGGDL